MLNALSIDLEEYYHADVFRRAVKGGVSSAGSSFSASSVPAPYALRFWPSRAEYSTDTVLELLANHAIQATFFVVGEVAEAHPGLIRRVAAAGHEIACHGYRHEFVSNMTTEGFRNDLQQAKKVLEDITGKEVVGFRAPNFSIGQAEDWAYDVLLEEGFLYDSSIFPIIHDRYGDPGAPRAPYPVRDKGNGRLMEFPLGTIRLAGTNFPISGGGYFRLFPTKLFKLAIEHVNRTQVRPIIFYFHPWELDLHQPRPPMAWHHRFRHYVGIRHEAAKLADLFSHVRFTTARSLLGL